jgi:hypothetical protein
VGDDGSGEELPIIDVRSPTARAAHAVPDYADDSDDEITDLV